MSSSLSCDHSVLCLSPCNLKNTFLHEPENFVENFEQWDGIQCPICREPPHNALLLRCSSFEHGCRAYMCDTSSRHTNCFDQFTKTAVGCIATPQGRTILRPEDIIVAFMTRDEHEDGSQKKKLICPLCRGEVYEIVKVKKVREFLNNKERTCSNEMCDFSGTYTELRNHARIEHPDVQPTKADPERLREWEQLEREEHERDLPSAMMNPSSVENINEDYTAYRDLVDCFLSIAYHTTTQTSLNPLDSSSEPQLHNNRFRRLRAMVRIAPRPRLRPNNFSVVDERIHRHIGVRRPRPEPCNRNRGLHRYS